MMFKEVGCKMQIAVSDLKCIFAVNTGIGCYLGGGAKPLVMQLVSPRASAGMGLTGIEAWCFPSKSR